MRHLPFYLFFLLSIPCFAQTNATGKAETNGVCSPAVSGSNNQFTMNCQGITREQGGELLKIVNTILRKELDPTIVLTKLDEIQSGLSAIQNDLTRKKEDEVEADRIRRTTPDISPYLKSEGKGKVYLYIKSNNLIPFQYSYFIVKSDNSIVGGFPISMATVYPKLGYDLFYLPKDINLDEIHDHYLELRFDFKSLSADELHLPGHEGRIIRKYTIQEDDTLKEIQ